MAISLPPTGLQEIAEQFNASYQSIQAKQYSKADNTAIVLKGDKLETRGAFAGFFTFKSTHRQTVDTFMKSLQSAYGQSVVDSMSNKGVLEGLKASGKPLTARVVQDCLNEAASLSMPLNQGFLDFTMLCDSSRGKIGYFDLNPDTGKIKVQLYGHKPSTGSDHTGSVAARDYFWKCLTHAYGNDIAAALKDKYPQVSPDSNDSDKRLTISWANELFKVAEEMAETRSAPSRTALVGKFETAAQGIYEAAEKASQSTHADLGNSQRVVLSKDGTRFQTQGPVAAFFTSKATHQRAAVAFMEQLYKSWENNLHGESNYNPDRALIILGSIPGYGDLTGAITSGKPLTTRLVSDLASEL